MVDYADRIHRVIDHVRAHVERPLRLEELAKVACLSPFHFHRIFKRAMGETLQQFVNRVRLERAVRLLVHGRPTTLTNLALRCGFSSSSDFSRRFKKHFGVPPSQFDGASLQDARREALVRAVNPPSGFPRLAAGDNPDAFTARLEQVPGRVVAYRCVHRPYASPDRVCDAARELVAWAEARDCADGVWLGYQWEDPEIVHVSQCPYYVGVVVPEAFRPEGEVGRHDLPSMEVAEIALDGPIELEMRALDWLYGTWLPQSRREPADQPCIEVWDGRPFAHGMERFRLRLQLPLTPAR